MQMIFTLILIPGDNNRQSATILNQTVYTKASSTIFLSILFRLVYPHIAVEGKTNMNVGMVDSKGRGTKYNNCHYQCIYHAHSVVEVTSVVI